MKRFKVERNTGELGIIYVSIHQPPYEDEDILKYTSWKLKDVTITEMKQYQGEE